MAFMGAALSVIVTAERGFPRVLWNADEEAAAYAQ